MLRDEHPTMSLSRTPEAIDVLQTHGFRISIQKLSRSVRLDDVILIVAILIANALEALFRHKLHGNSIRCACGEMLLDDFFQRLGACTMHHSAECTSV